MEPDLVAYLMIAAPDNIPWSQVRNLIRIRRAYGRPMSVQTLVAIRLVLAAHDHAAPDR
jgi:hypothetical protein